jgi:hypothetical protein
MSFAEIFNKQFFITLGLVFIVLAIHIVYTEHKYFEMEHKLSTLTSLASTMTEDITYLKSKNGGRVGGGGSVEDSDGKEDCDSKEDSDGKEDCYSKEYCYSKEDCCSRENIKQCVMNNDIIEVSDTSVQDDEEEEEDVDSDSDSDTNCEELDPEFEEEDDEIKVCSIKPVVFSKISKTTIPDDIQFVETKVSNDGFDEVHVDGHINLVDDNIKIDHFSSSEDIHFDETKIEDVNEDFADEKKDYDDDALKIDYSSSSSEDIHLDETKIEDVNKDIADGKKDDILKIDHCSSSFSEDIQFDEIVQTSSDNMDEIQCDELSSSQEKKDDGMIGVVYNNAAKSTADLTKSEIKKLPFAALREIAIERKLIGEKQKVKKGELVAMLTVS